MDVDPETKLGSDRAGDRAQEYAASDGTQNLPETLFQNRYHILKELGRGGFGITYLAEDFSVASRNVVLKILNDHRSRDSWSVTKFQSEMQALARIDHPNVISIFDVGYREDLGPFLVMQYVRGHSLRERLRGEGLPLPDVAHILKQVGRALSAAHDAGICHRDLKPENILVQSDTNGEQQIKLIDFGIASIREEGESSVHSSVAGTYSYMAPEQFYGNASALSDIFQMGVVAYELVTGIKPFRAATPTGIVLEHMEGLRVLPCDLRPELPESAQTAILKAMSQQPEDRYQRARDFGDEIASILLTNRADSAPWIRRPSTAGQRRGRPIEEAHQQTRTWLWALAVGVFVAAIVAVFLYWRSLQPVSQSVAVLPFENRTGDANLAYLSDGIGDSLINDLSHIPSLRVIGRGSVSKYTGSKMDAQTIGKELDVERVIDGSISRNGDNFYLDTEMLDVHSGVRVWGYAYSAKISSLAEVLQQFSIEVTDQLRLKLSGTLKDRLKRQYAAGSKAYEQYLKGRYYLNKRTTADFQEAIRSFNGAIAADPDYAPAFGGLATTYAVMASFGSAYGGAIPAESLERARLAAERALQLDGTLAEAYAARANVELQADYNWRAAEQDFRRSIALDPNSADAHEGLALELGSSGSFEDAIRELRVSTDLEPEDIGIHFAQALVYYMARRYDESLHVLTTYMKTPQEQALQADFFAENYWAKSMPDQALSTIERIPPYFTPEFRLPLLAGAYARVGRQGDARRTLSSYVIQPDTCWWYYLALAHLGLHDNDEALEDLERSYQQHYMDVIWYAVDPMLDELHSAPRFRALLSRIGRRLN